MKGFITIAFLAASVLCAKAQQDVRPVVGVAEFTCGDASPYSRLVTEKVVEMLTNTKRFRVVDRTSIDKIHAELELQKSEAFLDSKNRVEQDVAVAAEKMITGHITKIPVYAMRNANGSLRGYKASVAFEMKVVDVATGLSTEATSFQGKASDEYLSPESAVTAAMQSLQSDIAEYFRVNFPVTAKVVRVLSEKGGRAREVLLSAGTEQGIKEGDVFTIENVEMIDGSPYMTELGRAQVKRVAGANFCECEVDKDAGLAVLEKFKAAEMLQCKLVVNK